MLFYLSLTHPLPFLLHPFTEKEEDESLGVVLEWLYFDAEQAPPERYVLWDSLCKSSSDLLFINVNLIYVVETFSYSLVSISSLFLSSSRCLWYSRWANLFTAFRNVNKRIYELSPKIDRREQILRIRGQSKSFIAAPDTLLYFFFCFIAAPDTLLFFFFCFITSASLPNAVKFKSYPK